MITPPKPTPPPEVKTRAVQNWLNGVVTELDEGRTPLEGLISSGNTILNQDGTVGQRPSLIKYGPQPEGTVLGSIYEFVDYNGLEQTAWLISLQNVSGTTHVYIAKGEDSSWTKCTGKTYDNTAEAQFTQIRGKVLIMNGTDPLSYLDIGTQSITSFNEISTPSKPSLENRNNLAGSNFNVYYAVTANSTVGETDGSPSLQVDVSTDRDLWDPDTQNVKISWSTVSGVESWNVYMGIAADGSGDPEMYLIAGGLDADTLEFTDNGSRAQNIKHPLPETNSTQGPKTSRGTVINGRVWMVGDPDNINYVWRGGDYGHELDFSPSHGGGFSTIGGGKERPVQVVPFRTGQGEPRVVVLSQSTNGRGNRYTLSPVTLTYADTSFVAWEVTEDSGQDGTDSPDGVVVYNNSLWYPSTGGFKTTGTKPQLQNVLSTDRISNTIQEDISTLNTESMDQCVGLAYEGRIYWALPVGNDTNNQIWVLDLDREGAWMKPWDVSADWMTLYNDNNGVTHFLVLSGDTIYELSDRALTADDNEAFATSGSSGHIQFSQDGRVWGHLIKVIFVLLRPQGTINFTISGKSEDSPLSIVGQSTFTAKSSRAGWSEPGIGWSNPDNLRGWSEIIRVPVTFNDAVQEVEVEVGEDLQWFSYGWSTNEPGVSYNLSKVVAEYVEAGIKDLS